MKKLRSTVALTAGVCWVSVGILVTLLPSYAQQRTEESRGAKLYSQNCAGCHGAGGVGSAGGCMMMSGPPLLSAARSMNANAFLAEVRHVGETNMCAGNLLDLSAAKVEAIRNYLVELSNQTRPD
jgi:mono/diheme cytochrome c family protein